MYINYNILLYTGGEVTGGDINEWVKALFTSNR